MVYTSKFMLLSFHILVDSQLTQPIRNKDWSAPVIIDINDNKWYGFSDLEVILCSVEIIYAICALSADDM